MDYVLVHGGWHGGWAWRRVADRLQAAGHRVFAPTLTGLGERSHLLGPEVDLSTHITDVMNLVHWEGLSDFVLCGHSYGGMIVSAVADRVPERVRALLYADALVPPDGTSLLDHFGEERREALMARLRASGDPWRLPPPPAESWNLADPADRRWVDSLTTAHPLASFAERISLTGRWRGVARKTFVLADRYAQPTLKDVFRTLTADEWDLHVFDAGHELMIEKPQDLTDLLLRSGA